MIHYMKANNITATAAPRTRGDDPGKLYLNATYLGCSPHARG